MSAVSVHLKRIPWDLFCTLTFSNRVVERSEGFKKRILFRWLRQSADTLGVPWHQFFWMVRGEEGELTGRHHFHALLCVHDDKEFRATRSHCFQLMHLWNEECRAGMARVRLFDPRRGGVDYVIKDLASDSFDPHSATDGKPLFNQDEANGYETGKFDRHNNTLIPAHALVRWWTRHSRDRRRLRARDLRAQFP